MSLLSHHTDKEVRHQAIKERAYGRSTRNGQMGRPAAASCRTRTTGSSESPSEGPGMRVASMPHGKVKFPCEGSQRQGGPGEGCLSPPVSTRGHPRSAPPPSTSLHRVKAGSHAAERHSYSRQWARQPRRGDAAPNQSASREVREDGAPLKCSSSGCQAYLPHASPDNVCRKEGGHSAELLQSLW